MFIAHEIGHNFNLRHPFDIAEDKGDLKLQQGQTLENIMDYLRGAQETYKSFIAYQWDKMREYLHTNKNTVEELNIQLKKDTTEVFIHLEDFNNSTSSNLARGTKLSVQTIINNRIEYYKENEGIINPVEEAQIIENLIFQNAILSSFKNAIINHVNNLCN